MTPPSRLRFRLGGYFDDGFDVRLSRRRLLYRKTVGPIPDEQAQVIRPSEEQWGRFWLEVDRIGLWAWLPEYLDHNILDGTQWSLCLAHAGRTMKSWGSNAYPGSVSYDYADGGPFADFLRALAALTGHSEVAKWLVT